MRVVIHQPHFLPWLGYFNKLSNADIFIMQDNVQFRRRYFQNRTKIRDQSGHWTWLTVPVHAKRSDLILDVKIADPQWKEKIKIRIQHTYSRFKHFDDIAEGLFSVLDNTNGSIFQVNHDLLTWTLSLLEIDVNFRRASEFEKRETASQTLIHICNQVGAEEYIFGEGGGRLYHGLELFQRNKIRQHRQNFRQKMINYSSVYYPGCFNLSVIDYLFDRGAEETSTITKGIWKI